MPNTSTSEIKMQELINIVSQLDDAQLSLVNLFLDKINAEKSGHLQVAENIKL